MKIIFLGSGEFATKPLQKLYYSQKHELLGVITLPNSKKNSRSSALTAVKKTAKSLQLNVWDANSPQQLRSEIIACQPELLVVCDYGCIVPRSIMRIPKYGCLNIHPSLLPRWRGAAPIERAILAGDEKIGVSIMEMDTGLDTGAILLQETISLMSGKTSGELKECLSRLASDMLLTTLEQLNHLDPIPQSNRYASYAPKIKKEESIVNWTLPSGKIERQIYALNPKPGVFTYLNGIRIKIGHAHSQLDATSQEPPGSIISTSNDNLKVACGEQGVLSITRMQRAGGKMMAVCSFLNGFNISSSMIFAQSPGSSVDRANPS